MVSYTLWSLILNLWKFLTYCTQGTHTWNPPNNLSFMKGNLNRQPGKGVWRKRNEGEVPKERNFLQVCHVDPIKLSVEDFSDVLVASMTIEHESFDCLVRVAHESTNGFEKVPIATVVCQSTTKRMLQWKRAHAQGILSFVAWVPHQKLQHRACLCDLRHVNLLLEVDEGILCLVWVPHSTYQPNFSMQLHLGHCRGQICCVKRTQ